MTDTGPSLHLKLGRGLAISAGLAGAAYLGFSIWAGWSEVTRAFAAIGFAGIAAALMLSLLNYGIRFIRWQMYLKALGHPQPVGPSAVIYLSGFAMTTTPGKAGELLRSVFLEQRGMSYVRSTAAFVSERLSDVIAVVLIALPGMAAEPRARGLIFVALAAIVTVGIVLTRGAMLTRMLDWLAAKPARLAKLARQVVLLLIEARRCHTPLLLIVATALSVAAWLSEAFAFHLVLHLMGTDVTLPYAVFVYAMSMLAGALSFLPGGLGGAEAVMVGLLLAAGVQEPQAIAATIIIRLTTLWFAVVVGLIAIMVGRGTLVGTSDRKAA